MHSLKETLLAYTSVFQYLLDLIFLLEMYKTDSANVLDKFRRLVNPLANTVYQFVYMMSDFNIVD